MSTLEASGIDEEFLDQMVEDPDAVYRGDGATFVVASRGERRRLIGAGTPAAVAALLPTLDLSDINALMVPRGTWELLDPAFQESLNMPHIDDWDWMEIDHVPHAEGMENVREIDVEAERSELERVRDAAIPSSFLGIDAPGSRWYGWYDDDGVLRAIGGAMGSVEGTWPEGAHYGSIGVQPEWQGRGIGAALTAGMVALAFSEGAARASLGVYTGNHRAIELYRRLGFTIRWRIHSRDGYE